MKRLKSFLQLARPNQYLKNGFIWLPLFFGYRLEAVDAVVDTALAFAAFCFIASSVYIINDIRDIQEDRLHPIKKSRPLASGALNRTEALIFFSFLVLAAGIISFLFLPVQFTWIAGFYFFLNIAYSFYLKHIAIIDVICISMGFVLRIFAGGYSADVAISPWIIIMTFLLSLFLALAKRRDDLILADDGHGARKSLDGYNMEFISSAMVVMASVIIVSYLLYTVSPEVTRKHHTHNLYQTSFWVIIGLLRYMQITFVKKGSGSPTAVLLKDLFLQAVVLLWLANVYWLIY